MWVWNLLVALLLLSVTSFIVTYVAVFHLALVERVVALLLRKGLRGVALDDAAARHPSYRVERKERGDYSISDTTHSRRAHGAPAIPKLAAPVRFLTELGCTESLIASELPQQHLHIIS